VVTHAAKAKTPEEVAAAAEAAAVKKQEKADARQGRADTRMLALAVIGWIARCRVSRGFNTR